MAENCMANYSFDDLREQEIYLRPWNKIPDDWKAYYLYNCLLNFESKLPLEIMIYKNNNIKNYIQNINEFVYWFKYKFGEHLAEYNNEKKIIEKYDNDKWYYNLIIERVVMKITNVENIISEISFIDDNNVPNYSYLATVKEYKIIILKKYKI